MTTVNLEKKLELLKLNLREQSSPYFSDEELLHLLEQSGYDVNYASYKGLLMKSEDDSISLPGGLATPNNGSYWLRLASLFRPKRSRVLNRVDA